MKVWKLFGIALGIYFISSMVAGCGEPEAPGDVIAFTNVNVIPMDQERVLPDQTVIIRDGRI